MTRSVKPKVPAHSAGDEGNTFKLPEQVDKKAVRQGNRRHELLDAAARRFCREGYDRTSVRDIAEDVGILSGSIYYHFASKEELLVAVHEEGVKRITGEVLRAIAACAEPWERLERACAAHMGTLLDGSDYAQVVIRELPREPGPARTRLILLRDQYEAIFTNLIKDLPLRKGVSLTYLRLLLLGALNSSQGWYQKGNDGDADKPADIAKQFVGLLRNTIDKGDGR